MSLYGRDVVTYLAAADMSAHIGKFVQLDGSNQVQLWDNPAQPPQGVLLSVDIEQPTLCGVLEGSDRDVFIVAGEGLDPGTDFMLTTDGTGKAVAAGSDDWVGARVIGRESAVLNGLIRARICIMRPDTIE